MSDLISREALMRRIQSEGKNQASQNANRHDPIVLAYGDCYAMTKFAPAVEAVEVVRCGDCKYFNTDECAMVGICDGCDCQVDLAFNSAGYCSHGKRRESEVSE